MTKVYDAYIAKIENEDNQAKLRGLFEWILEKYPNLTVEIKWNQPMFLDHGVFIIGFSFARNHFSVAPEDLDIYVEKVEAAGYSHGKKLFRIMWDQDINYDLMSEIIETNMAEKKDCTTFWRPNLKKC